MKNFKHTHTQRKKYKEPSCTPYPTSTIVNIWGSLTSCVNLPPPFVDNFKANPRQVLFNL